MSKSTRSLLCAGLVPIFMVLATSGCATKGFVRNNLAATNSKVSALETKTSELAAKQDADMSRVNEHLATTDSKLSEVATTAQQANTTANQANQLAQQNQSAIATNAESISTLNKSMNYSMVAHNEVLFAFDRYNLSKSDQATLDQLIQQAQAKPRSEFELIGFTDPVGSKAYNLGLSRRRADAVARYLVNQGVQLRQVNMIGMGKESVPERLESDAQAIPAGATTAEAHRLSRRVIIRVYAPDATLPSQSASLQ